MKEKTLVLSDEKGRVIFSSENHGLRPLLECVQKFKGFKNCNLKDKVIGLAAARIIVYSGIISAVETLVCSDSAKELLEKNNVKVNAETFVANILNNEKTRICPMEKMSISATDNKEFYFEIKKLLVM